LDGAGYVSGRNPCRTLNHSGNIKQHSEALWRFHHGNPCWMKLASAAKELGIDLGKKYG